jgi:predicted XRE-type DNA-binding protein
VTDLDQLRDNTRRTLRDNVKAHIDNDQRTQATIAALLGLSRPALRDRLILKTEFAASELAVLAVLFDTTVDNLIGQQP